MPRRCRSFGHRRGSRKIEHLGSAHDEARLELLKAATEQCLAAGQRSLDLGLDRPGSPGAPLEIVATRLVSLARVMGPPDCQGDGTTLARY